MASPDAYQTAWAVETAAVVFPDEQPNREAVAQAVVACTTWKDQSRIKLSDLSVLTQHFNYVRLPAVLLAPGPVPGL